VVYPRVVPYPGRARALTPCGVAGAVLFVAVVLADGAVRPGVDPVADTVAGGGWLLRSGFVVTGILLILYAVGLAWTLRTGRAYEWVPRLVATAGVALLLGGGFATGDVHDTLVAVAGAAIAGASAVLARRFVARAWVWYSRLTGAGIVLFGLLTVRGPDGYAGLCERIAIVVAMAWIAVVSWRARVVHRAAPPETVRADDW
jgi:hypothetical membrane protein